MKLFGSMNINKEGHLEIGGIDTVTLAKTYGTPLYVMDEAHIRHMCGLFKEHFQLEGIETEVIYASKAFLTLAMCRLIAEEGLSLDVVSGGELYTAMKANFPLEDVYFHGNNKSNEELKMAITNGVGRIIVDNEEEVWRIEQLCQTLDKKVNILIRVNPGIEAHTHEYIKTTKNNSKFGLSIFKVSTFELIEAISKSPYITLKGFHSHIGSQIFEVESFYEQVRTLLVFMKEVIERCQVEIEELNLGGGFGIYYTEGDQPIELDSFFKSLLNKTSENCKTLNIKCPKMMIEPGRAIVANAGITLYEIGGTKETFSGKNYLFVDGGMNDNIRTALYQASYEAAIANRMNDEHEKEYTVTGKCCESGDILVREVMLPTPQVGDLLVVGSTGAYNYSMASNYNRLLKPAVLFVKEHEARVVVKRETYEDLIRNDV